MKHTIALAFAGCATPETKLASRAKVTRSQAEAIALKKAPGGRVKEAELEVEHGKLVWSFDIARVVASCAIISSQSTIGSFLVSRCFDRSWRACRSDSALRGGVDVIMEGEAHDTTPAAHGDRVEAVRAALANRAQVIRGAQRHWSAAHLRLCTARHRANRKRGSFRNETEVSVRLRPSVNVDSESPAPCR